AMKATAQEIEIELRAQIERALQFGVKPTHLDTHMRALSTRKDFFDVYTKLGKEYGIPVMVMRPTPEIIAYGKQTGLPITEDLLKKVEALIKELGVKLTTWREMGKIAWKKLEFQGLESKSSPDAA